MTTEKVRRFINRYLLPKSWHLIKWYGAKEYLPSVGAFVIVKCGAGLGNEYCAYMKDNGNFYSIYNGKKLELVTRWRYVL